LVANGGANNYDVDYKLASSSTWSNAATATASLSVNLIGLTANSLYDWRVKPNCAAPTGTYTQAQFHHQYSNLLWHRYRINFICHHLFQCNLDLVGTKWRH
jgi:hypothetical protein